jgi:hypothetical protein
VIDYRLTACVSRAWLALLPLVEPYFRIKNSAWADTLAVLHPVPSALPAHSSLGLALHWPYGAQEHAGYRRAIGAGRRLGTPGHRGPDCIQAGVPTP